MGAMEQWREIPGYPELEASTLGQIRRGAEILPTSSGGQGKNGYLKVYVQGRPNRIRQRVHVLVARTWLGDPEGRQVRHLNGDKRDNRLTNLAYGTNRENVDDMVRHGTHWQLQKTHCPAGHLLAGDNLMPSQLKRGWRACLTCDRERKQK